MVYAFLLSDIAFHWYIGNARTSDELLPHSLMFWGIFVVMLNQISNAGFSLSDLVKATLAIFILHDYLTYGVTALIKLLTSIWFDMVEAKKHFTALTK